MKLDFLFPVLYSDQDVSLCSDLGVALRKAGVSVGFIAHTRYGERELKERHENVYYLYEDFDPKRDPTSAEINAIEKKYDLGSIYDFVYPEQAVPTAQSQRKLIRRAVHDFRFLEELCTKHQVGMCINNLGPELMRRCMFRFRDKGGPPVVVTDFAPIHGRITLTTHEILWDDLPSELPEITSEQRARMVAYIAEATRERKTFCEPAALPVGAQNFVNAVRYAQRALSERVDFSYPTLLYQRAESLARVRMARLLYEAPVPGEPYYFFPLHLMDDSAITIRAPQFQRQEEVVQYIAERVLPWGTKLYVKPHPAAMHAYSYDMLSRIAKIPNVRLIDARIPAPGLIADSKAVIVINSTVGFEAVLYGKPVIALGKVFYRGWGVTTDVDQLADLRLAVARAVDRPVDMERVYRFLQACFDATFEAHLTDQTPENLKLLTDALVDKARNLGLQIGHARSANGGGYVPRQTHSGQEI